MRIRSPNYPSLSLSDAIDLTKKIYDESRTNPIDREAAVKDMGYSGITGRSAKLLATLLQYALLERAGKGGVRVTKTAVDIIHPDADGGIGRRRALLEAAFSPGLFHELRERFSDGVPSENALKSYLMRQNFADVAVGPAINAYLETCRFLQQENAFESHGGLPSKAYDSVQEEEDEDAVGPQRGKADVPPPSHPLPPPARDQGVRIMDGERVVFVEETGPERYLKLVARGEIDASLLEALDDYVKRLKKRLGSAAPTADKSGDTSR